MKNSIRKIGKFYTRIIMKNIGIFIFVGLLSVVFNEHGWMPNKNMYAISQFAYDYVIPLMIAYEGGRAINGQSGGILAVLGTCGLMAANLNIGLFGAMLFAPVGGYLWKLGQKILEEKAASSMQMLGRNLGIGIFGGILAAVGFYLAAPLIEAVVRPVYYGVNFLVEQNLIFLLSILIEPAKVFFLNNVMNHGILVPLGMNQVREVGQSCLFLLEVNPGPGLGMLAALWYVRKEQRNEYVSAMFAQSVGGIHEVYFPFVLADLWLLVPLIFGGTAGGLCFEFFHAGLQGAVSPGSIITILLLAGKESMAAAAIGILVSALVSFAGSVVYLKAAIQKRQKEALPDTEEERAVVKELQPVKDAECAEIERVLPVKDAECAEIERVSPVKSAECAEIERVSPVKSAECEEIEGFTLVRETGCADSGKVQEKREVRSVDSGAIQKIGFVCDGGMGSSAMGAAVFRRTLAKHHLTGIQVEVFAADLVEEGLDLIVCQEDFFHVMPDELKKTDIYTVTSFLKAEEYEELIEEIEKSRGPLI